MCWSSNQLNHMNKIITNRFSFWNFGLLVIWLDGENKSAPRSFQGFIYHLCLAYSLVQSLGGPNVLTYDQNGAIPIVSTGKASRDINDPPRLSIATAVCRVPDKMLTKCGELRSSTQRTYTPEKWITIITIRLLWTISLTFITINPINRELDRSKT